MKRLQPWFDEECFRFFDKRKQAKEQRVQDPNQSNVDNVNNARREVRRHFRNKKKQYLTDKIDEHETPLDQKYQRFYRGISDFKKGYQVRTDIAKDEKGDLVADSNITLAWGRKHFSQLLNVHGVSEIRQTEIDTAEPLVPESSTFEFNVGIGKLRKPNSLGIYQIQAELNKQGVGIIRPEIHILLILSTFIEFSSKHIYWLRHVYGGQLFI